MAVLMDTLMESVSVVVVPAFGVSVTQPGLAVADHVSVPLPGLVTFKSLSAGLAPPCVPLNASVDGFKLRTGCAVNVKEAVMV